ncbi:MAG: hypothetical protein LBT40_07460, partial [Deltaproteobacteria bacterium]|jgi:hypothetical protein|nr:hypothetical protein [Deltaproteobacteria bacterium]
MLTSVIARGDICTDETLAYHREVQDKMGPNIVEIFDNLTNGNYSRLEEANKSLEVTVKSLAAENEDLRITAIQALRARNMSPEVIARALRLQISEVNGILKSNGAGD